METNNESVIIEAIRPTKNGSFQLMLRQRKADPKNVLAFFMEGHVKEDGSKINVNTRVAYQTVSGEMMKKFNFAKGQNLGLVIGQPVVNIEVIESHTPRSWADPTNPAQLVYQKHKIYPEGSKFAGQPITSSGRKVYRDSKLVFTQPNDTLLPNDPPASIVNAQFEAAGADAGLGGPVLNLGTTK